MAGFVSADTFEAPFRRIAVGLGVFNAGLEQRPWWRKSRLQPKLHEKGLSVPQTGYILIVESDDLIRELLERWLGEAGYRVVTQSSSAPVPSETPSLVIANAPSPRGAGALVRSLQEALAAAPILLISARFRRGLGTSNDAARRLRVRRVLPKPFTRVELLGAVRECLAGR